MTAVLAAVEDVKRVLHLSASDVDDERDGWLQDELDSAESWFLAVARVNWAAATGGTQAYYDVREDDSILLPQPGCTVTAVRVFFGSSSLSTSSALTSDQYDIDDDERVLILRPATLAGLPGLPDAVMSRQPGRYRKVEIDWDVREDAVPEAIRDGLAMLAAGQFISNPRLAGGYSTERIGDYSYSVRPPAGGKPEGSPISQTLDFTEEAMRRLRPFLGRRPLVS